MSSTARSSVIIACTSAALLLFSPGITHAQWFGDANGFSYSNGADLNGLFGTPFVGGANNDTLIFSNFQFSVSASNGAADSKNDTVTFDVLVDPGLQLNRIHTIVTGDLLVIGADDSSGSYVDLTTAMTVTELNGSGRVLTNEPGVCDFGACDLIGSPVPFPRAATLGNGGVDFGQFSGLSEVDFSGVSPAPASLVRISLSVQTLAQAFAQGSATLNTNLAQQQLQIIIPEPATLGMLGMAMALVIRRRRA
jgi:hypothetical protein